MRKFILLFFLLYVAKYGNSAPVSQSTLLSVRRLILALPRCYKCVSLLMVIVSRCRSLSTLSTLSWQKNHSAAATRSHPSRQSSPNIDCKRFAPTLYWVIIVWLLGGYCAIHPLCLCNLFHIAIITSTKTFEKNFNTQQAKRGCFGRYCFTMSMLVSAWILRRQGAGCDWLQKFRFLHVNVSFWFFCYRKA